MPIRLIIFDLDGTLVDSILDTTNAVNYALRPHGLKGLTPDQVAELLNMTNSISGLIHEILKQYGIYEETRVTEERYLEYYSLHLTDTTIAYPGAKEVLEALNGCWKAIVTNKPGRFAVRILDSLGLFQYFDVIVGGDTVIERKPSPVPMIHALANFNVKSDEAILVGDCKADIDSGKAAGLRTVAATYGYGKAGFEEGADFVIITISNLIGLIKNISG